MFECSKCQRTFVTNEQLDEHQCLRKLTVKRKPKLIMKMKKDEAVITELLEICAKLTYLRTVKLANLSITRSQPIDLSVLKQLLHVVTFHHLRIVAMVMLDRYYLNQLGEQLHIIEDIINELDPIETLQINTLTGEVVQILQSLKNMPIRLIDPEKII